MDIKEIQNLIKFVSKSGVNEVSIEQGEFKITIKSDGGEGVIMQAPTVVQAAPVQQVAAPVAQAAPVAAAAPVAEAPKAEAAPVEDDSKYITIKSPMIGTFYRRSSPDKDAFVNVGDSVAVGDVLCIVEAMKLFNEIESEVSGKVVKVLVDDTSPIEYDQPLFLIDPS
ncbi:MAG: acetyl-CoA carboxylase biotin carboxyl carrier protein [Flavobacteriales bacterium]|nr:acetyl-CoA carboxylase biotin carboxyl carrier protein [Flavobacteriales bacterium]